MYADPLPEGKSGINISLIIYYIKERREKHLCPSLSFEMI